MRIYNTALLNDHEFQIRSQILTGISLHYLQLIYFGIEESLDSARLGQAGFSQSLKILNLA